MLNTAMLVLLLLLATELHAQTFTQVNTTTPQTLSNKTLTSPILNSPILNTPQQLHGNLVNVEAYPTVATAVSAIGAASKTLWIPSAQTVSANLTIPSNVTLYFTSPGNLTCTTGGVTISIQGYVQAPPTMIFNISGGCQVLFSQGGAVIPHWWGSPVNGVNDDKPFIDQAVQSLPTTGGILFLPCGTYRYVSNTNSNSTDTFNGESSNLAIYGAGFCTYLKLEGFIGMRIGLPRADINRYCTTPPTGCTPPAWGQTLYKAFQTTAFGATVLNMVTASDANSFSIGDVVFLESGDASPGTGHPPFHFEYNEVTAVDGVGGTVTLKYPTRDNYDSADATYPPLVGKITTAPQNIVIRDLRIQQTSATVGATALQIEGSRRVRVENSWIQGLTFVGYSQEIIWTNNLIEGFSATADATDWGDAIRDILLEKNTFRFIATTGFRATGSVQFVRMEKNLLYGTQQNSTIGTGIVFAGNLAGRPVRNIDLLTNTLYMNPTGNGGTCFETDYFLDVTIRGNTCISAPGISTSGSAGVVLTGGGDRFNVSENHLIGPGMGIYMRALTGTNTFQRGDLDNNFISSPNFGIRFQNDGGGATITNIKIRDNEVIGATNPVAYSGTITALKSSGNSFSNDTGTATFASAATKVVTFTVGELDANYNVVFSGSVNETFWVTAKTVSGFTLNSSNATSTATVNWVLTR